MKVKYTITRYGSPEFRSIDIDIEAAVRKEVENMNLVLSCGGFNEDALDTIEIDYDETTKDMVIEHL